VDVAARIILAAILLWAAVAKARGFAAFRTSLEAFAVPPALRSAAAAAVVGAEAVLGGLLLVGVATGPAALATVALAALFVAALLLARRRGHTRLACRCFGGARAHDTMLLVLRAAAVGALAALVAAGVPGLGREDALLGAVVLLGVCVAVLALLVLALYRQVGVLSQRLGPSTALEIAEEGPVLNSPPPPLEGLAGRGAELVAFVSANCRLCHELSPAFRAVSGAELTVRAVEEGDAPEVFESWNVPGTPFVALVIDGVVRAKGLVNSLEQIDGLIDLGKERARGAV
jgi:uncharacterized membrane protein YphA (DoxX/SURF4 family)